MFISFVKNLFKRCCLYITRIFKNFFKNFGVKLSLLLVIFSFLISLFFMIPSLFSRVPVFDYFIETLSLPLSYKLEGSVVIINDNDEKINQMITVYIGGYSTEIISGDTFVLSFSSETTDYFYITVEYQDQSGAINTVTQKIETNGDTTIKKVIYIYV